MHYHDESMAKHIVAYDENGLFTQSQYDLYLKNTQLNYTESLQKRILVGKLLSITNLIRLIRLSILKLMPKVKLLSLNKLKNRMRKILFLAKMIVTNLIIITA